MVKQLMHDLISLAGKSEIATKKDLQVTQDLVDSLIAHKDSCVVMAANMIGVPKWIIVFGNEDTYMTSLTLRLSKNQGLMIQGRLSFTTLWSS